MNVILYIVCAYLIGSIPTAVIIGLKFFNKDIRNYGSKNPGGTNAGRVLGKTAGIAVSFFDVLKVFLPAVLAKHFFGHDGSGVNYAVIVGLFGMLGHCYPVFAKFKGGKAVSSFFAIVLAADIYIAAILVIVWILLRYITNYVSLASMISGFAADLMFLFKYGFSTPFFILFIGAVFVVFRHRSNIERLLNGTENKINNK